LVDTVGRAAPTIPGDPARSSAFADEGPIGQGRDRQTPPIKRHQQVSVALSRSVSAALTGPAEPEDHQALPANSL